MYKKISYLFVLPVILLVSGCSDVLTPAKENHTTIESMAEDASYAEGVLINAYTLLPGNGVTFTDVATDNAVSNDNTNDFRQMAAGQWTAEDNPLNEWKSGFAAVQYLNLFIENADIVEWATDPQVNALFNRRMKGEAYGMRANFYYHLLRQHGGWTGTVGNGELLGVPLLLEPQDKDTDFSDQERATFEQIVQQIYSDVERARELLVLDYESDPAPIPAKYDTVSSTAYNRVFGDNGKQRMSGRIAMAIKARTALLAASPAYNAGTTTTWADAATYAGELLELNGGVGGIAPEGNTWYDNGDQIENLSAGENPPEVIWRTNVGAGSSNLEEDHYPPTLFGNGRLNPTQDLVNAFPMEDGYPPLESSNYDPDNPYQNRVEMLQDYVLVNGGVAGPNDAQIFTSVDGGTNDGLNEVETSTRTGYYMKKLLRQQVNRDPSSINELPHYTPRIRYTEIYLAYAEAANEAWGPNGDPNGFGFTAESVIAALRARQGVTNDDYLANEVNSQADMRDLIRDVRRIELAFEDFRFWDLRRWNIGLTETADGVSIEGGNHTIIDVEPRDFEPYQRFGPVPYSEVLKYDLQQNYGW